MSRFETRFTKLFLKIETKPYMIVAWYNPPIFKQESFCIFQKFSREMRLYDFPKKIIFSDIFNC